MLRPGAIARLRVGSGAEASRSGVVSHQRFLFSLLLLLITLEIRSDAVTAQVQGVAGLDSRDRRSASPMHILHSSDRFYLREVEECRTRGVNTSALTFLQNEIAQRLIGHSWLTD